MDCSNQEETSSSNSEDKQDRDGDQSDRIPKTEDQLMMTKQKTRCRWMLTSLLLLTMFLVTTVSVLLAWVMSQPSQDKYLVLLDAGSVHTSVYTYKYSYSEHGIVNATETHHCELKDLIGISSFKNDPAGAAKFVTSDPCVLNSVKRIPPEDRKFSSIELVSTAGMRVIRLSDPEVAQQILGNLTQQLNLVGRGEMRSEARIMSGETEAVSSWVTAMLLSDNLVAALDWGGASAQVNVPGVGGSEVTVEGDTYTVYSRSNLCYGQAESRKRHLANLAYQKLKDEDFDTVVSYNVTDPCLPAGAVTPAVNIIQLFSSPCTQLLDTKFMQKMKSSNVSVSFISKYNFDTCSNMIRDLQFSVDTCNSTWQKMRGEYRCLDPSEYPPPQSNLTYLAMSTYWYLSRGLGLNPNQDGVNPPFSMTEFLDASQNLCSLNSTDSRLIRLKENSQSACYQSLLMYHLLTDGYHFNVTSWDQLRMVKRLRGSEVGWGLGYATINANNYSGTSYISVQAFVLLLLLGGVFLILSLGAAYKGKQDKTYATLREL